MKSIKITICILLALFLFGKGVLAYQSPGTPTGFVNDFAGILNQEQKQTLETKLTDFREKTTNEISVVAIKTLGEDNLEQYANALFREWGIGGKEHSNGVLLLIVVDDRKIRIETGYGLEGALPDILTKQIQEESIVPEFKKGDYYMGITNGVDSIIKATQGEYTPTSQKKSQKIPFQMVVFVVFFGFQILSSILAPTKSWWLGGVLGGIGGGVIGYIFGALLLGSIGFGIGIIFGLLLDYFVSKNYQSRGFTDRGDFWSTGGFGGGSLGGGRSGGFGGFSGGSSGGGGSSSSW